MQKRNKKCFAVVISSVLLISSCSTMNPYTGESQMSDSATGMGVGTMGGAALGAIVGGGRGALIGGALGAMTGGIVGYTFDQENAELRKTLVGTGVQVKKVNNSIQLMIASDVTFATNQADVRSSFYPTLNSIALVLKKYNKTSITITGFTDDVGSDAYNQRLSEARANSVGEYLVSRALSTNRIFTQGMGKRDPIAPNTTYAGKALNRRVIITLRPLG